LGGGLRNSRSQSVVKLAGKKGVITNRRLKLPGGCKRQNEKSLGSYAVGGLSDKRSQRWSCGYLCPILSLLRLRMASQAHQQKMWGVLKINTLDAQSQGAIRTQQDNKSAKSLKKKQKHTYNIREESSIVNPWSGDERGGGGIKYK